MFKNLFRPDGNLAIVMTQITDCIFLTLFFMMGCVPVLTVGASFAALYDSVFRTFRKGEKHSWMRFFHTFRQNWKQGILPTVLFLAGLMALSYGVIQLWNAAVYETVSWAVFAAGALLAVVLVGVLSVLFPMLSRFENSLAGLLKNTVILSLANLPRTVVLGMINTATALLCMRYIFPAFFLPAVSAFLDSYLIEPMFKPYLPEEESEEIEELEEAAE